MKNNSLHVRIAAGIYRGRKILLPSLESTRSTKSIVKGSFFDTFQREIHGVHFVEMFGGSGSMGLEALSRGAKHAYFIEKDKKAYEILKSNCMSINKSATTSIYGDAFKLIGTLLMDVDGQLILYMDPPFSIRDGMEGIYEETIKSIESLDRSKVFLVAVEHMSSLKMPDRIGQFTCNKTKRFGKSSLTLYM